MQVTKDASPAVVAVDSTKQNKDEAEASFRQYRQEMAKGAKPCCGCEFLAGPCVLLRQSHQYPVLLHRAEFGILALNEVDALKSVPRKCVFVARAASRLLCALASGGADRKTLMAALAGGRSKAASSDFLPHLMRLLQDVTSIPGERP